MMIVEERGGEPLAAAAAEDDDSLGPRPKKAGDTGPRLSDSEALNSISAASLLLPTPTISPLLFLLFLVFFFICVVFLAENMHYPWQASDEDCRSLPMPFRFGLGFSRHKPHILVWPLG